mgnify:CR=1 FL=1
MRGHMIMWFLSGLLLSGAVEARERLTRVWTVDEGLPTDHVKSLAQDSRGFLWLGTGGGLVRFDGTEFVLIETGSAFQRLEHMAASPLGPVRAVDGGGELWDVSDLSPRKVPLPDRSGPAAYRTDLAYDAGGTLWVSQRGALYRQPPEGAWVEVPTDEPIRYVEPGPDGTVLALGPASVWRASAQGVTHVADFSWAEAAAFGGGRIFATSWNGVLDAGPEGATRRPHPRRARPTGIGWRDGVLWTAQDRFVTRWPAGGPPEVIEVGEVIRSGGAFLVDREGSLWLGTFHGLVQLPEPETWAWREPDGMASSHARRLTQQGGVLRIGTWTADVVHDLRTGEFSTYEDAQTKDQACYDRRGARWAGGNWFGDGGSRYAVIEELDGVRVPHDVPGAHSYRVGCTPTPRGTVWLATHKGVFETPPEGGPPVRRAVRPDGLVAAMQGVQILEDRRGRLWVAGGEQVCHAGAEAVRAARGVQWDCRSVRPNEGSVSLIELANGDIWLGGYPAGVARFDEDTRDWHPLRPPEGVPSTRVTRLVPSRYGGVWLLSHGSIVRVSDAVGADGRLQAIERLDGWHGLVAGVAHDVLETEDALYFTGMCGLMRVPLDRTHPRGAPEIHLVSARSGGAPLALDGRVDLPGPESELSLRFAATSFRAPSRLQYRVRLAGDWSEPRSSGVVELANLRPGPHRVEVAASLDGATWSNAPATYDFVLPPPWHERTSVRLGGLSVLIALLWLLYRARVAVLLREERLRMSVAMDLHDELGAGLGSIGLLSGVLEGELPAADRDALLDRIGTTARELGESVSAIVWSLRPGSARLDRLVGVLSERALRLFPGVGDGGSVEIRAPEPVPSVLLSTEVVRAVQAIALEALHNAARHGGAQNVVLEVQPDGAEWVLRVIDDGVGLDAESATGSGLGSGVEGMHRRAEAIGARLSLAETPGGGVTVSLAFRPR